MSVRYQQINCKVFSHCLRAFKFDREVNEVHLHAHPLTRKFQGRETVIGLKNEHTQQGMADIAHHLLVDPKGGLWVGRNWEACPASVRGQNGNRVRGPFSIAVFGEFGPGSDPLQGQQRKSVVEVIAHLRHHFGLAQSAVVDAVTLSDGQSLPGFTDWKEIVKESESLKTQVKGEGKEEPFGDGHSVVFSVIEGLKSGPCPTEEHHEVVTRWVGHAHHSSSRQLSRGSKITPDDKRRMRPHVINSNNGGFSTDSFFNTEKSDIDKIVNIYLPKHLEIARSQNRPLKIVLYSHGGLVSEKDGFRQAMRQVEWWLQNGVYPIFFIWETGFWESIEYLFYKRRSARFLGEFKDRTLEGLARTFGGGRMWTGMKAIAEKSCRPGGANSYFLEKLVDFLADNNNVELHGVGHSAGSVLLSHAIRRLRELDGPSFKTMHFKAPAITIEQFKELILQDDYLGEGKGADRLTIFTMNDDLERDDNCVKVYGKSLLYLISYALEAERGTRILGMERDLHKDHDMVDVFGLDGSEGLGELILSTTHSTSGRSASQATSHGGEGGFGQDAATLNSIVRRVLDVSDTDSIVEYKHAEHGYEPEPSPEPEDSWFMGRASTAGSRPRGNRRALCIGIDTYSHAPLYGCVNDANRWYETFNALGFQVRDPLINSAATRNAILNTIQEMITESSSGDVLAIHYSGHGTFVPDLNGDEQYGDTPGQDEALCPVDYADGQLVIDDDLGEIFKLIPAGVSVTCFFDCCHSGSATRFALGRGPTVSTGSIPRFIHLPSNVVQKYRNHRAGARAFRAEPQNSRREVLFSACRSDEVALESGGLGDFTRRATKLLAQSADYSNEAFLSAVEDAFGQFPAQHPELHCAKVARNWSLFETARSLGDASGDIPDTLRSIANRLERVH